MESYKTGRGAFRLRARYNVEELPRGQYRIIVTEIPYQVQKGKLETVFPEAAKSASALDPGPTWDEKA